MTTKEVEKYYQSTLKSEVRPELKYALSIARGSGVAIDCGCGAGSNIKHLRAAGYTVYAYDKEKEAIALCEKQYKDDPKVILYLSSFGNFSYPSSSLIIADASLFFCPISEFDIFMQKIFTSLKPQGVFCGTFLGVRDTMASSKFNKSDYWGNVLVLSEAEIRHAFKNFQIVSWQELEKDGTTATGESHHWHIFIVVAKIF